MNQKKKVEQDRLTIQDRPASGNEVGGRLELSSDVVATIAGIAAREIGGIHSLGKSRLISFGDDPKRGVGVEVGQTEAALDLEVVIEYGVDIQQVVGELRRKIADVVYKMAGRKVVEVNVNVVGIKLAEEEPVPQPAARSRVQ